MTGPRDNERGRPPDPTFADVLNGFTFDSGRRSRKRRRQQENEGEVTGQHAQPEPETEDSSLFEDVPQPVDELSDSAAIVRPYAWTRGRTRANQHLELETLVSTSDQGWDIQAISHVEHRFVAELCRHPHAVAEVAAKLSVPLGVARVLLSDMAEQGLITVHQTVAEDDDTAAQLMLMERVLSGLRRL